MNTKKTHLLFLPLTIKNQTQKHHPWLGPVPDGNEGEHRDGQEKPEIQREREAVQQILHHKHGCGHWVRNIVPNQQTKIFEDLQNFWELFSSRGVVDQESTGGKESRSDPDSMANSEIEDSKDSLSDRDSKKKKGVLKSSKKSRR